MTISEALERAQAHLQAGQWPEAEHWCRQVLAADPRQAAAWEILAAIATEFGQHEEAVDCLRRAIEIAPHAAELHNALGEAYRAAGRLDAAEACYRQAVAIAPRFAIAHNNLGVALKRQGRINEALTSYRQAIAIEPGYAEAHYNLGIALAAMDRLEEALASYREAIRLAPNFALAHCNLGVALFRLRRHSEAVTALERAVQMQPDLAAAHHNLGAVWQRQRQLDKAIECYRKALQLAPQSADAHFHLAGALADSEQFAAAEAHLREALQLRPDHADSHSGLGMALQEQGLLDESLASYRVALRLAPDVARMHYNIGTAYQELGLLDEAAVELDHAVKLQPDHMQARANRAMVWLQQGHFNRGWPEYEYRWQCPNNPQPRFSQPAWDGGDIAGRTILIYAEQGLGDTLQFVRYAALVRERGARVIVRCQKPLAPLLRSCPGIDQLVPMGEPLPPFDMHAAMVSLPGLLHTTVDTIPASVPYLFAEPERVARWKSKLAHYREFKIGVVWQGRQLNRGNLLRSAPLVEFAPLAQLPRVRLISLQKGYGQEQIAAAAAVAPVTVLDEPLDENGAFLDTAAVMTQLDLVICVDTAIGHLAGALGVPVWLALGSVAEWRWLTVRDDTPWYPSMRLFRQSKRGDWKSVFSEMSRRLESLLAEK